MALRTITYGYEMKDGKITVCASEAEVIEQIYRKVSDYGITEQGKYSGKYALSEKLFCGECGSVYRRKMWKIGGKRKPVWRCLNRLEHGTQFCHDSITLDEDKLHQAICIGLNQVSQVKEKALDLISTNLMYAVTGDSKLGESKLRFRV